MVCINCFKNFGFRYSILLNGSRSKLKCNHCKKNAEKFVTKKNVGNILQEFFFEGTITPQYLHPLFRVVESQKSSYDETKSLDYRITTDVIQDLNLIRSYFNYDVITPHINMRNAWGDTILRWEIQLAIDNHTNSQTPLNEILHQLILCCKKIQFKKGDLIFRIRKNPKNPHSDSEYDSPPLELSNKVNGRFNNELFQLFYCSNNIETCLYESKFDPTDIIIVATYQLNRDIEIVDLENTDSDYLNSLDQNLQQIFNAEDIQLYLGALTRSTKEYNIMKLISSQIFKDGYTGLKYSSFFNRYRETVSYNIGIFGFPIKSNLVTLVSLNNIVINSVEIKWKLGPCLDF